MAASILIGVCLAVYGQVYQTGADAFGFFGLWAILFFRFKKQIISVLVLLVILAAGVHAAQLRGHITPNVFTYFNALPIDEARYLELYDPLAKRHPWTIPLDVEKFHAFTGDIVGDAAQGDLLFRQAQENQHDAGMMAFGRHRYVFPGSFAVTFDLVLQSEKDAPIASLDIAMGEGRHILASLDTAAKQGSGGVSLEFKSEGFWVVEPRVYYHGIGSIDLHGIAIQENIVDHESPPKMAFYRVPREAMLHVFPFYLNQIQMKNK